MQQLGNHKKILIVKPSSLGDIIHSLPFLNVLKECYPSAEIHWVVSDSLKEILEGNSMINKLWLIQKDKWKKISHIIKTSKEFKSLYKSLRNEEFDLVIDLQGLLRSGLISWATHAPKIVGFKEAREGSPFFYTHHVKGGRDIHAVDRYLRIAKYLSCEIKNIQFPLHVDNGLSSNIDKILPDRYAVIVPGTRWKTKRWPPENFGYVASRFHIDSVILGSNDDIEIAEIVLKYSQGKAISLTGKTSLSELIAIINKADFMLTNDTGPMHIAAALNVPVFALFGPTDPEKTGPYGKGHTIIKSEKDCSPCFKKKCKTINCLKDLSFQTVYEIIADQLDQQQYVKKGGNL